MTQLRIKLHVYAIFFRSDCYTHVRRCRRIHHVIWSFLAVLNVFRSSVFVATFCREVAALQCIIAITLREKEKKKENLQHRENAANNDILIYHCSFIVCHFFFSFSASCSFVLLPLMITSTAITVLPTSKVEDIVNWWGCTSYVQNTSVLRGTVCTASVAFRRHDTRDRLTRYDTPYRISEVVNVLHKRCILVYTYLFKTQWKLCTYN